MPFSFFLFLLAHLQHQTLSITLPPAKVGLALSMYGQNLSFWFPGVIAQMFEWNWASIALECTQFLGPAGTSLVCDLGWLLSDILGYGYVQSENTWLFKILI